MSVPPRPPPLRPSAPHSLRAAWRTLKADPIGLLLPTAGILLVQLLGILVLRTAVGELGVPWADTAGWVRVVGLAAIVQVVVLVLVTPLRAALVATGASALGAEARPLLQLPALLVVDACIAVGQALAWCAFALPGVLVAGAVVAHGGLTLGAVLVAASLVLGALAAFAVRVLLAYVPFEVIVGGRGPVGAFRHGWQLGRGHRLALAFLLLVGDTLTALGGLMCGAGALPGYPIGPLAVLHRWVTAREVS